MVMDPNEPAAGERAEPRRPLLMDPAGPRPSGFAPPAAGSPAPGAPGAPTGGQVGNAAGSAVGRSTVLGSGADAAFVAEPGAAAFGPVSQVVRISVRTASSRLDLVLPDRSTVAETLETVLELAPRSLREQAIAHGGWILRTAAGEALPGSMTLLDQGVVDGSTLFLTGVDGGTAASNDTALIGVARNDAAFNDVAFDDVADAVAAAVRGDPGGWPSGAGRLSAMAAAGVFGGVAWLALLWTGPPWTPAAVSLAILAAVAAVAAGWLGRAAGDAAAAVLVGMCCVISGATAAAVAVAGTAPLRSPGAPALLLGGVTAILLAAAVAALVGVRAVPLVAVVVGSLVVCLAAACGLLFALPAAAGAAIVVGVAMCVMPAVPRLALALAGPGADTEDVDPVAVGRATRRATGYLTAQLLGLSWAALAGCVVLAVSDVATAQVLAATAAVGLLLRARLFPTIGQRVPLVVAGIGSLVAVLLALMTSLDPAAVLIAVAAPAIAAMILSLLLATLRRPLSPELARGLDILDVLIAVVILPLVAAVLGLFSLVRGIGG
jgi:type VII secretion integral membrane protein EccD